MQSVADKYISQGGRTAGYDKGAWTDDLMTLACFLAWAQEDGAYFGGHDAKDAFQAMARLLDLDGVRLRKIMTEEK